MIPFLVADRPISLSIIKGISLPPRASIGVLSQAATTTDRFKQLFRAYPFETDVMYPNGQPSDLTIQSQTIKMVDNGMFGKHGCHLEYSGLFAEYEKMGADYGIVIDVMRDAEATVASAREAMVEYQKEERSFKLVGVVQGESVQDYLHCYERLLNLGYKHIAVGGLLRKRENTARYVYVRCCQLMEEVLRGIRCQFDPDWLFALGVLHPSRVDLFCDVGVWGSDYKGWIFNYEKKDTVIELIHSGGIKNSCRIAAKDLSVERVQKMSEQKLRFFLARSCIERRIMDPLHGRRLLVVACSVRKHNISERSEAWTLYDGVAYRLMKKAQREEHFPSDVDVFILSAEHGLISPSDHIARYDRKMNKSRATQLAPQVTTRLKEVLSTGRYREVLLWMGKEYLESVKPVAVWAQADVNVHIANGPIGQKLSRLKEWLLNR